MRRAIFIALLFLVTMPPRPAAASCALLPRLEGSLAEARTVFVGTVTETTNARRWATVDVEEVWKGDEVSSQVDVRAGPEDPPGPASAASSVDRHYRSGTTYLFVLQDRSAPYADSSCSATQRFGPRHEAFRPAHLAAPTAGPVGEPPPDVVESYAPWAVVAVLVVAAAAGLMLYVVRYTGGGSG